MFYWLFNDAVALGFLWVACPFLLFALYCCLLLVVCCFFLEAVFLGGGRKKAPIFLCFPTRLSCLVISYLYESGCIYPFYYVLLQFESYDARFFLGRKGDKNARERERERERQRRCSGKVGYVHVWRWWRIGGSWSGVEKKKKNKLKWFLFRRFFFFCLFILFPFFYPSSPVFSLSLVSSSFFPILFSSFSFFVFLLLLLLIHRLLSKEIFKNKIKTITNNDNKKKILVKQNEEEVEKIKEELEKSTKESFSDFVQKKERELDDEKGNYETAISEMRMLESKRTRADQ